MQTEIGKIYDGKISGITKFGAFVELEHGESGMVHISEVSNTFVSDISEHLKVGEEVKVKVLSINEQGKISLSIKKALPPVKKEYNNSPRPNNGGNNGYERRNNNFNNQNRPANKVETAPATPESAFEDMLNKFKHNSEERMGDIKKNVDNKRKSQSRRK